MSTSPKKGVFITVAQTLALAVLLAVTLAGKAPAAETIVIVLDQAKIMRLPETVQTVIIGNPAIADVTVQKSGVVVVTGKSYGVTNLIALDPSGQVLEESMIRVQAATESIVTVQRGLLRESLSCSPQCQPAANLGDGKDYFKDTSEQTSVRNALANGSAPIK